MTESSKDGRIELLVERIIPEGGSLEVTYQYRLKPEDAGTSRRPTGNRSMQPERGWPLPTTASMPTVGRPRPGYLKRAVGKDNFVRSLEAAREPLGKMISREVQSEQFATRLPGAPEGQYVVIQFKTSLANAKSGCGDGHGRCSTRTASGACRDTISNEPRGDCCAPWQLWSRGVRRGLALLKSPTATKDEESLRGAASGRISSLPNRRPILDAPGVQAGRTASSCSAPIGVISRISP